MTSDLLCLQGLGGAARLRLEAAFHVCAAARLAPAVLHAPWRTGDPGPDVDAVAVEATQYAAAAARRPAVDVSGCVAPVLTNAPAFWMAALQRADAASEWFADILAERGREGRPLAVVAFGLGTRVALTALRSPSPDVLAGLRRLVLVGSTEPVSVLAALPVSLREGGRVVNVCFPRVGLLPEAAVVAGGASRSGRLRAAPHAEGVIDLAIPVRGGVDDLWLAELIIHIAREGPRGTEQ
jgi:hypothetical protein